MCPSNQRRCWKGSLKSVGDTVTNEHLGKCVKMCVTDIWVAGNQSNMETCACKYGTSISCLFIRNRALKWEWLVHMSVIEA